MATVANTIGEAWVLIQGDTHGLESKLKQARSLTASAAKDMENRWMRVGGAMKGFGLGATLGATLPIIGLFAKGIAEAGAKEPILMRLAARLRQTGEYTKPTIDRLNELSESLQRITIYSDDAILETTRLGAYLRVPAKQLDEFTKAAIGLAERAPGRGGKELSLPRAATILGKAFAGDYQMIQQFIPELKTAADKQQAWGMVLRWTAEGFRLAEERTKSLKGAVAVLTHQFEEATENLAVALLPNITKLVKGLTKLLEKFNDLKPEQQRWVAWGLAAAAAIGPVTYALGGLVQAIIAYKVARIGMAVKDITAGLAGGGLASKVPGITSLLSTHAASAVVSVSIVGVVSGVIAGLAAGIVSAYRGMKDADEGKKRPWNPLSWPGWWMGNYANKRIAQGETAPGGFIPLYVKGAIRKAEEQRAAGHGHGSPFLPGSALDTEYQTRYLKSIDRKLGNGVPVAVH